MTFCLPLLADSTKSMNVVILGTIIVFTMALRLLKFLEGFN